jgi:putative DNA primase/helicase
MATSGSAKRTPFTPEEILALMAWYKTSQSSGKISAMLTQAHSKLALDPRLLEESMYHLVCANGIVDLRTGQCCEPEETDYSLHWTPVEYQPDAPCPLWETFITDVTEGEPEMADFLKRVAGYSTVGSSIEQTLLFFTGRGSNGKGAFCRTVSRALGEYAVSVNADFLHKRRYMSHPTDIIQLQGSRLVVVSTELAPGEGLDESRVKTLTGGDFLRGRGIAKDFEQFLPTFSIIAMTNHLPMCRSQDDGWWRRLAVVPFPNQWAPPGREEQMPDCPPADLRLEEKLQEELPGVLRWCIEGARDWCEQGLALPTFVQEATKRYRAGQDPLAAFALAHLVEQQDAQARARAVYVTYCRFQAQRGLAAMTETAFGTIMSQRYESKRTNQGKVYLHVRPVEQVVEDPQE